MTKVYIVEQGWDYEGSQIVGVYATKELAIEVIEKWKDEKESDRKENILKYGESSYWNEHIENLPTGYKWNDNSYIYREFEVLE